MPAPNGTEPAATAAVGSISVLVADAQRLFAHSLGRALALEPDLSVVDEFPAPRP